VPSKRVEIQIALAGNESPNSFNAEIVWAAKSRRMQDARKRRKHGLNRLRIYLVTSEIDDGILAAGNYQKTVLVIMPRSPG